MVVPTTTKMTPATSSPLPSIPIDFKRESFRTSLKRSRATALGVCATGLPPFGSDPEDVEVGRKEEEVAIVVGQEDGGLWLFRTNLASRVGEGEGPGVKSEKEQESHSNTNDNASIITRRSISSSHTPTNLPSTPRTNRTPMLSRTSSSSFLPTVLVSPPTVTKPFANMAYPPSDERSGSVSGSLSTGAQNDLPGCTPNSDVPGPQHHARTASIASNMSQMTTATTRSRSRSYTPHQHHPEFLPAPPKPSASTGIDVASRSASPAPPNVSTGKHVLPSTIITDLPSQSFDPTRAPSPTTSTSATSTALKNRLLATQKHSNPSETPDRLAAIAALGRGNLEGLKGKSSGSTSGTSIALLGIQEKSEGEEKQKGSSSGLRSAGGAEGGSTSDVTALHQADFETSPIEKAIDEEVKEEQGLMAELDHVAKETERMTGLGLGVESADVDAETEPRHPGSSSKTPTASKTNFSPRSSAPNTPKSPLITAPPHTRCPVRILPHSSLLRHTVAVVPLSTSGSMAVVSAEGGVAILDTAAVQLGNAFDVQVATRARAGVDGGKTLPDLAPRLDWTGAEVFSYKEVEYLVVYGQQNEAATPAGSEPFTRVVFLEVVTANRSFVARGKVDLPGGGPVSCLGAGQSNPLALLHVSNQRVYQYTFHVGPKSPAPGEGQLRSSRSTSNFTSLFSPAPSRPASRAGSIKDEKPKSNSDTDLGMAGLAKLLGKKSKALTTAEKAKVQHAVVIDLGSRREVAALSEAETSNWTGLAKTNAKWAVSADPHEAQVWVVNSLTREGDRSGENNTATGGLPCPRIVSSRLIRGSEGLRIQPSTVALTRHKDSVFCIDAEELMIAALVHQAPHWTDVFEGVAPDAPVPRTQLCHVSAITNAGSTEMVAFTVEGQGLQLTLLEAVRLNHLSPADGDSYEDIVPVTSSAVIKDPKSGVARLLAGGEDGSLRVWDVSPLRLLDQINIFPDALAHIRVVPPSKAKNAPLQDKVLLLSASGTIGIFDLLELDLLYIIPEAKGALQAVILKGDDLIITYSSGKARVWNLTALEFRRSTATDAAEDMLEGEWQWLVPPVTLQTEDALVLDMPSLASWEQEPGQMLQGLNSMFTTRGGLDVAGARINGAFGLRTEHASIYPQVSGPDHLWSISSEVTGAIALFGTALSRPLLSNFSLESVASTLITEVSAVLPTVLGHAYIDVEVEFLARLYDHGDQEVHQSARVLLEARLARLNDMEAVTLVDDQSLQLPSNVPKAEANATSAAHAVLLVGGLALRRFNLFSASTLKDIASSILIYLGKVPTTHQALAIDLCHRGFSVWQNYVDPSELLRSLFALAVPKELQPFTNAIVAHARVAVLHLAAESSPMFITTLSMDIMDARSVDERGSVMRLCVFITRKKPRLLFPSVPRVAEAVVKSLDPTRVHMRESIQETATVILNELVKTYPVIDFAGKVQRLAVGTSEGAVIMYDLKTATRLYVVETHRHRVSALAFSPDGRRLVTVSVDEAKCTVWKVGSSFSSLFNIGGLPRQGGGPGEPFRTFDFALPPEAQAIDPATGYQAVEISWPAERSVCLTLGLVKMTFAT